MPKSNSENDVFDCPMNDRVVTIHECRSCGYYMKDKSFTGCGWIVRVNGKVKRGNGKGDEKYIAKKD
jgi:hypothetical protein